jgi:hypothetical protein
MTSSLGTGDYTKSVSKKTGAAISLPTCEGLVMLLHDKCHRTPGPHQPLLEPAYGIPQKVEVIQVNIEDRTHASLSFAKHKRICGHI